MLPTTLQPQRQTRQLPSEPFLRSDARQNGVAAAFDPQMELANMQDFVFLDHAVNLQQDFSQDLANEHLMPCSNLGASSHSWAQAAALAGRDFPRPLSDGFLDPSPSSLNIQESRQGSMTSSSHVSPKSEPQKSEICSVATGGTVTGDGMSHEQAAWAKPKTRAAKGQPMPHKEVPKRSNLKGHFEDCPTEASAATTLMIRNVPNKCDRADFMAWLDSLNFKGQYNFVYLPIDSHTRMNVGFAFVNFDYPEVAQRCIVTVMGNQFPGMRNQSNARPLRVSVAHLQGLEANMAHFRKSHVLSLPVHSHRPWVRKKDARLMRQSTSVVKNKTQADPASKDEALATASLKPTMETHVQVEAQPEECSHFSPTEQAELDPKRLQQNMDMLSFLIDTDCSTAVDSHQQKPLEWSEFPVRTRPLQEHNGGSYSLCCEDGPMKVQPLSVTSKEQPRFEAELQPGQKSSALDVLGQFLGGSGQDVLREGPVIDEEASWDANGRRTAAQMAYQMPPGLAVALGGAAYCAHLAVSGGPMGDSHQVCTSPDMYDVPSSVPPVPAENAMWHSSAYLGGFCGIPNHNFITSTL